MFFFDSHGSMWSTCRADDVSAVAFGPAGCARPATADEVAAIGVAAVTPWLAADAAGLLLRAEEDGFDVLGEVGVDPASLWFLADSATHITTGGRQGRIVITPMGRTFDARRTVRVAQDGWCWEGSVDDWRAAVAEAAGRPLAPGPDWAPGHYEAAARA